MDLSSCEMALVIGWPVLISGLPIPIGSWCIVNFTRLTKYHLRQLPLPSASACAFTQSQTHLVWYLFALCQRTVEVKERCQSVPFGYQRPAVEMNNMRIAHMRQAHNIGVWLKKLGFLCMRMKQKEKNI
ncbi:hypothetical protein ACUYW9_004437 [Cronobacter sakazakii]